MGDPDDEFWRGRQVIVEYRVEVQLLDDTTTAHTVDSTRTREVGGTQVSTYSDASLINGI